MKKIILLISTLFAFTACSTSESTSYRNELVGIVNADTFIFSGSGTQGLVGIESFETLPVQKRLDQSRCSRGNEFIIRDMGFAAQYFAETYMHYGNSYDVSLYPMNDYYGRELAAVYVDDRTLNLLMVENGYALPSLDTGLNRIEPAFRDDIMHALYIAKSQGRGLWYDYYNEMQCLENMFL